MNVTQWSPACRPVGSVLAKVTQSTPACRSDGIRAHEGHAIDSSVPFVELCREWTPKIRLLANR
ncbi:MAG: hypothetical protein U5K84_04555 [Alkalibacterium sp.]|nr:hypothetical protein [Alkalibacterium sp.]